ncbi:MAG: DUF169 domain-containing protein [Myxococcota bacterium]|nr:DUF169 domain-containing protein [Myxococcota bacterium]
MQFVKIANRFLTAFDAERLDPPIIPVGVKFIPKGARVPAGFAGDDIPTPWCGAVKIASEGSAVVITEENIGCPAGGIALGLVDADATDPLPGDRKYTSLMRDPAAPADFTNGYVYACADSRNSQFALFGESDVGRYKTLGASRHAVAGMCGLDRSVMSAVLAYPYAASDLTPDVVILSLTPKQALRTIQGYAFSKGDRVTLSTIGIRGVCADVTALPYLEQRLNGSFFCLGARALAGFEGDRLALGMPYGEFCQLTINMEESRTGFPYRLYPA